jgi:hypothetical protein
MSASTTGPRRAIWGLVNDGYALVAKTANLTHDEAFELCRVPDIGDPSAYLDQGVAYLRAPKWGHVFARYFTNAERDSAGRASLVYDVVALSDSEFASVGHSAFQALPPVASDRRPERFGELPTPQLVARDATQESARLAELLVNEDREAIAAVFAAVLSGDHALCIASGFRAELIEAITLLLPPPLRLQLTFQSPTADFPKYTPRLTVAERGHALLVEREWSTMLPRDAQAPRLAEARADAARLVTLGSHPDRLRRAWASTSEVGSRNDLRANVAEILRMDLLHEGLRTGDLRRVVLIVARADRADERVRLADVMFEHASSADIVAALVDVVQGEQRGAWQAVHAIASAVARRRDQNRVGFAEFFRALADALVVIRAGKDDSVARDVRVMTACAVASLNDLERFLDIADPSLPWDSAWRDGFGRWVTGRSPAARLFDAIATTGATYSGAMEGLQAVAQVASTSAGHARDRAHALALAIVRRTLRERATLEPPDRLGLLVDALIRVWSPEDTTVRRTAAANAGETERAVRRFFGVMDVVPSAGDPRRLAIDLSRAISETGGSSAENELVGWVIAALERAHAGSVGELTVRAVAALLDDLKRNGASSEVATTVGRVLLHLSSTDAAFVFRPAWLDVVRQADEVTRQELLARAVGWVARGYATGRFTIGAFADACAAAGAESVTIDDATVELLLPHLTAAAARGKATELSLLSAAVAAVATPSAVEKVTTALLAAVPEPVADSVRMRRLALALHEIESVRDEDRYADARAALRRVLAQHAISLDEERALRTFLGVEDGTVIRRILGRLPSLTPAAIAGGDRR